jgi:ankyrin repeat protein
MQNAGRAYHFYCISFLNAILPTRLHISCVPNRLGATPLHDASKFGHLPIAQVLLHAKADLSAHDK